MNSLTSDKSYAPEAQYKNFYAGGDVSWSKLGSTIFCLNKTEVSAVDVATGLVKQVYSTNSPNSEHTNDGDVDDDVIYSFALAPNDSYLATAHRSGLLRLWTTETAAVTKLWKSQHKGPVVKVEFSACGSLICSSGADSTLRIWDFVNSTCVCALKEFPGPALVIKFHPDAAKTEVFAAGADNTIYYWNYVQKKLQYKLRGHLSQVTALSFESKENDCRFMASASRDKVLIIWRLSDGTQHKVIPMYEELEGVFFLPPKETGEKGQNLVVASAEGNLKLVNYQTAKISSLVEAVKSEIKNMLSCLRNNQLAVITAEHNILIYDVAMKNTISATCIKQLIGFNDEILDLCFLGEQDRFLAVATNSKNIKIYDTATDMNCKIVAGHKDTVMTLSTTGSSNHLLSAGKDFSICLWELSAETFDIRCVVRYNDSHTSTIGCISFGWNLSSIFASVSQDGSLKLWNLVTDKQKEQSFALKYAAVAHTKEVNSVAFSPNNKLLATASQDKTAKLWSTETQSSVGTLRGHTRGVWCIRFSPVDQIAMTSSSDCSVRIWSLSNMACLKRLEQECTVLRAEFLDCGKYIVSAASDGLIKIWNLKSNACIQTLDEHSDRVWSLAISTRARRHFYSGGADSKLIKWHDVTEQCKSAEIEKRQSMLQQEQTLQTLLQEQRHMQKAFALALTLGKPKVSFRIISQYVKKREPLAIQKMILQLNSDQCGTLLEHIKAWSTNSRLSKVANSVLNYILRDILTNPSQYGNSTSKLVEALTPYVQRHFKRANELTKELMFLEFIVNSV